MDEMIKVSFIEDDENPRRLIELKHVELKNGDQYQISETQYGDVEIARNFLALQKQLTYWESINPQEYIDEKISKYQKELVEWQLRKDAMDLTDEQWKKVEKMI